jgi:hypothetical protein
MSLADKIALWNTIGTWVAGLATTGAVIFSLYLLRRSERVRLSVRAGLRILLGDGYPQREVMMIEVTNLGDRTVTVNSVGWSYGVKKERRFCLQMLSSDSLQYPVRLEHGQTGFFQYSITDHPHALKQFVTGFLRGDMKNLSTLRAQVHTSVNQTVDAKPEEELLKRIRSIASESNAGHGSVPPAL